MYFAIAKADVCRWGISRTQGVVPGGSGGSLWMNASSAFESRGWSSGLRYIGSQNASQRNPIAPGQR